MSSAARPWITLAAAAGSAAALVLAFRLIVARLPSPASAGGAAAIDAVVTTLLFGALAAIGAVGARRAGLPFPASGARAPLMAALGAAIGLGALLAALLYATLAGLTHAVAASHGTLPLLLLGTLTVAVQAGAEELLFRGWLQRSLARDWSPATALVVASLAFALLHVLGGTRAPLSLLNILLAGGLFGLLLDRTGGLAAPIAAHILYNWAETILFGLDPNPGVGSFGAVRDLDLAGSALWGGSGEGLNASIGLTVALVAAILPFAATWGRPAVASAAPSGAPRHR